jgi:hypothetical protein
VGEYSSLIYKFGKGIAAVLSAEDVIKGVVMAEMVISGIGVEGTLCEDVVISEISEG